MKVIEQERSRNEIRQESWVHHFMYFEAAWTMVELGVVRNRATLRPSVNPVHVCARGSGHLIGDGNKEEQMVL